MSNYFKMSYYLRSRKIVPSNETVQVLEKTVAKTLIDISRKEVKYNNFLEKTSVELELVDEDGSCLYNCLSICLKRIFVFDLVINSNLLMNLCRHYIFINQNKSLENNSEITFKEVVRTNHDMSIDEYMKKYTRTTSKNWGGLPEMLAVSELFRVNIFVFLELNGMYVEFYCIKSNDQIEDKEKNIYLLFDDKRPESHYSIIHMNFL